MSKAREHILSWVVTAVVLGTTAMLPFDAGAQMFTIPAPDTLSGNFFGGAVAIDGNRAIVGATGEDSCGANSGAAFLYEINESGDWALAQKLVPRDCREGHFFGNEVAIDGDRVLVSSYRTFVRKSISNSVYVFERREDGWIQTARLESPDKDKSGPFASSIALDGDKILITSAGDAAGQTMNGVGWIFEINQRRRWRVTAELNGGLSPKAGVMGTASALDGGRAVIAGSTYSRGEPGVLYIFDEDSTEAKWYQTGAIRGIRDFFISVDVHEDLVIVGESRSGEQQSGRARIISKVDGNWTTIASLRPSTPYANGAFGTRVAINGTIALVSGFDEQLSMDINVDQVVYVYEYMDGKWKYKRILDRGQAAFGSAIDLKNGLAAIGQASDSEPGQVYVVKINRP